MRPELQLPFAIPRQHRLERYLRVLLLCGALECAQQDTHCAEPVYNLYRSVVREDDGPDAHIFVVRVRGFERPAKLGYATVAGTAKAGEDYIETAGTVEFEAGSDIEAIFVPMVNDNLPEETESFSLRLSDTSGTVVFMGAISILDDDGVRFELDSYLAEEEAQKVILTILRGNDAELGAFTVDYATTNGTALASQDYVETRGTVVFGEGEMRKSIAIPILRDDTAEEAEQLTVTLSNPTGKTALGTVTQATVTINDRTEPLVVNPMVAEMRREVRSSELVTLLNEITGETPVIVDGRVGIITTRITFGEFRSEEATQFVYERLKASGLPTRYQDWSAPENTNRNVIAIQPGISRPEEIVVAGAHLDSTSWSSLTFPLAPGADDNASGSGAVITAARILGQYQFERTIHYVLFTAEEAGGDGSRAYVSEATAGKSNLVAILNLEMMAWDKTGPPRCALITSGDKIPHFSDQVAIASIFTGVVDAYQMSDRLSPALVIDPGPVSDHQSFWAEGFPAICIAEDYRTDTTPYYHSDMDRVRTLNTNFYTAMVQAIVGTVAHLARPVEPRPREILEIINSDWTVGSAIGSGVFYGKHEVEASEGSEDAQDVNWSSITTNLNPTSLTIYSDAYGVALQTDSRPLQSETMFHTKLAVVDKTSGGVSSSNQLRFSFMTPPDANRVYLARIHVDGRYIKSAADFDCVTNLEAVIAEGGLVQLPNLNEVPDGTVYGTCDVSTRFLDASAANCHLRIASVRPEAIFLLANAQLGAHLLDELLVSTNLSSAAWMPVQTQTNYISPDAAHFENGWTEIVYRLDTSALPASAMHFFELKRTWLRP